VGCNGGAEIAVQIRAERSSPRIESGTNCRGSAGNYLGVCKALSRLSLFLADAVATVCGDYEEGLRLRPHGQKHMQILVLDLC